MIWGDNLDRSARSPLVVLLHGYSSDHRDLASLIPYLPREFRYLSLRAPEPSATPYPGFQWFPLRVTATGVSEEPADAALLDAGATAAAAALSARLNAIAADPAVGEWDRLAFIGFSQGAITGLQLWRAEPDRFTTGVLLSGMVAPREMPGDELLAKRRPPLFWGRGDADAVIPAAAVALAATWLPEHFTVSVYRDPRMGHEVSMAELEHARDHLRLHLGAHESQ